MTLLGVLEVLEVWKAIIGILKDKKALEVIEEIMIFSILKNDTENITRITGFFEIASNFSYLLYGGMSAVCMWLNMSRPWIFLQVSLVAFPALIYYHKTH